MRVITGSARGRKLTTPQGLDTRPTSDMCKEAVFSILHDRVENAVMLDLFAGSGQMGVEALSRGAKRVVFIDRDRAAIAAVKENLKNCGFMERSIVAQTDSLSYIKNCQETFDLIFLDPPYQKELILAVLPDAARCLKADGILICECERSEELPQEVPGLRFGKEYRYGKAKVCTYFREEESPCGE